MDSRRQKKIANLIKEAFSEILQKQGSFYYPAHTLVTITNVLVTSDVSIARLYFSIFNADEPKEILGILEDNKFELRHALAQKLRHQLRKLPNLEFYLDDTMDEIFRIEEIFKDIKENDDTEGSDEQN